MKIAGVRCWLWGLLVAGVGMRVFGAWSFAAGHTADHGIICLMVKHMHEAKEFPVFFYGLPYMGSIEPLFSLAFCALFGVTDFWINMGTALPAILLLPVVYLWGVMPVAGRRDWLRWPSVSSGLSSTSSS